MKKQKPDFVIQYADTLDYQKTIARAVEDMAAETPDLKHTLLREFTGDRLKDKLTSPEEKLKARKKLKKSCASENQTASEQPKKSHEQQWKILVCRSSERQTIGVAFFLRVYPQFFMTYKPETKVDEAAKKNVSLRVFWMAVRGHARKSVGRKPMLDNQDRYASIAMMAEIEKFALTDPRISTIEAFVNPNDTNAMRAAEKLGGMTRSELRTANGDIRYIKQVTRALSAK